MHMNVWNMHKQTAMLSVKSQISESIFFRYLTTFALFDFPMLKQYFLLFPGDFYHCKWLIIIRSFGFVWLRWWSLEAMSQLCVKMLVGMLQIFLKIETHPHSFAWSSSIDQIETTTYRISTIFNEKSSLFVFSRIVSQFRTKVWNNIPTWLAFTRLNNFTQFRNLCRSKILERVEVLTDSDAKVFSKHKVPRDQINQYTSLEITGSAGNLILFLLKPKSITWSELECVYFFSIRK